MAEHLIFSVPEWCESDDCPVGVHIAHYWIYDDDDTYSKCDSDGNHEGCDEADVPSSREHDEAWLRYARQVARTGEDPLGEYYVSQPRVVKESWRARARNSILGVMVWARRHGHGPWIPGHQLPKHVRDYLCLTDEGRGRSEDYINVDRLGELARAEGLTTCVRNGFRYVTFKVDGPPIPRGRRPVIEAARKSIRDLKARLAQDKVDEEAEEADLVAQDEELRKAALNHRGEP